MARYPIGEAARRMGVSKVSLRSRVQRGTMNAIKDAAGVWQIEVPDVSHAIPHGDAPAIGDASAIHRDVQRLESENAFLRERLVARDRDIERITQSLLALTMQRATLADATQMLPTRTDDESPTPATSEAQRGAQPSRRGNWRDRLRRWFGGN